MDAYGGNDEESAELRKLLAEVVRRYRDAIALKHVKTDFRCRTRTRTTLRCGRNWSAPAKASKAE